MHTWVRRGLQTALVTGGLLMLGTGIASADESVNPDTPPSPVDAGVSVPIDMDQNALGTPVGQMDAPSIHRTVSTGDVTGNLPMDQVAPVAAQANPLVRQAQAQPALQSAGGDLLRGNKVVGNVVVPVQICGNAIAAGGDAAENGMCSQTAGHPDPIHTDGSNNALAGNVVAGNATVPVQATGNAVAVIGNAAAQSVAGQSGLTGGNITTSGDGGTVSGTIGAVQWATPVQVADNAVAGGGNAASDSASESDGWSKGSLRTGGDNGTGAGTLAGAPVGVPVQLDGNGVSGIGNAAAQSQSTANSTAGTTDANNIGLFGHPSWGRTTGDASTVSGNVVQPQASGPLSVDDNAGGLIGNQSATSTNNSTDSAGGLSSTTGSNATGSGNYADAPVALPTSGAGNGVVGIGNANANHTNNVGSTAGGDTLTNGDNSTLSGNSANVPPAGAVDVCGDSAGGAGGASGQCDNNVTSTTGGYNGTTGNGSTLSGNEGQTPTTLPVEGYGAGVSGAGNSSATTDESKTVSSGGTPNTHDDGGTGTSNEVVVPTAIPAQAFGDAVAVIGNSNTNADSDTTTTAGGSPEATGKNATAAGNIVYVPSSAPTQVFGDTATLVGNGNTMTTASTTSTAGGDASSTGDGGSVSGNVVEVSNQVVDQAFGNALSGVGIVGANTCSTTNSTAGGDVTTDGDYASLSGNAIALPDTISNEVFGVAGAVGSNAWANGANDSNLASGGSLTSTGIDGSAAGNVLALPVALDPDAYGDAASVLGRATGIADQESVIDNGGDTWTDGFGPLSAYNFNDPLGADIDLVGVEVPLAGSTETLVEDNGVLNNGYATQSASTMDLPLVGGLLGGSTLGFGDLGGGGLAGTLGTGNLGGGAVGTGTTTPALPDLPGLGLLNSVPLLSMLSNVGGAAAHTQSLPGTGVGNLPTVPQVPLAQGAVGQVAQVPAQSVVSTPASMLQGSSVQPGISGVLPVQHGLFPHV
ncbi:MAG TPA: hypothetical protein VH333_26230 [Pseudonocardiaceae bacterium]|nr:hypothetical protein [Pseudonocardiaceae bacterium]